MFFQVKQICEILFNNLLFPVIAQLYLSCYLKAINDYTIFKVSILN